jgi:predicted alpha/beta superfamily hydrolase
MKGFLKICFLILVCNMQLVSSAQKTGINQLYNSEEVIDSIYSETLKAQQKFWIKFPENYNPKSDTKYPVVYLLDGFSLKDYLQIVYYNYQGHYLPHMILVGISNEQNRTYNLTTSKVESRRGAAMNIETGGADQFVEFIEKELIPHIDKTCKTTTYRTLIGHSYAGLFTINVLINHPHLFNNFIAIDPSLDWDNQKLLKEAKIKLETSRLEGKSLFVALAAEQLHMFEETITMDNLKEDTSDFTLFPRSILEFCKFSSQVDNGLYFDWKVYPEDLHGTVPLPAIRDGLVSLFKWFQFASPPKYNNPETTIEDLKALLDKQEIIYSKNFGYVFPPMVEELFVGYGQMYSQTEQPEKAKLFLSKAIEYYPDSIMVYEAFAEYYEMINDKENTIKYLKLAYKNSGDEQLLKRIEDLKHN